MRNSEKKIIWMLRVALFIVGAAAGYFIIRQIALAYPSSSLYAYRYMYSGGTALLLGLILFFSAKSIMWLTIAVARGIKNVFRAAHALDAVGCLIGVAVGVSLTFLFDFLLSLCLSDYSLRVVLDVVFALFGAVVSALIACKLLHRIAEREDNTEAESAFSAHAGGYLLMASALMCDGIAEFCRCWTVGKIYVADSTVSELISLGNDGATALQTYNRMLREGIVNTLSAGRGNEKETCLEAAKKRRLRIVAASREGLDASVPVLEFALIADSSFCKRAAAESAAEQVPSTESGQGQTQQ